MNKAMSQLADWDEFIQGHEALVKEDLSRACRERDLLMVHPNTSPENGTGDALSAPETCVHWKYHIYIGRRMALSREKRRRINQLRKRYERIHTFDHFVDIAENIDRLDSEPRGGVRLTDHREDECREADRDDT